MADTYGDSLGSTGKWPAEATEPCRSVLEETGQEGDSLPIASFAVRRTLQVMHHLLTLQREETPDPIIELQAVGTVWSRMLSMEPNKCPCSAKTSRRGLVSTARASVDDPYRGLPSAGLNGSTAQRPAPKPH